MPFFILLMVTTVRKNQVLSVNFAEFSYNLSMVPNTVDSHLQTNLDNTEVKLKQVKNVENIVI